MVTSRDDEHFYSVNDAWIFLAPVHSMVLWLACPCCHGAPCSCGKFRSEHIMLDKIMLYPLAQLLRGLKHYTNLMMKIPE